MKKYLIILFLIFHSCNRGIKNENNDSHLLKNDSLKYFLNSYEKVTSIKGKKKLNDKALEYLIKNNPLESNEYLDKIISNYFDISDWKKYNIASQLLLKNSLKVKDSVYLAKAYRYRGNYFYQKITLDSSFYYYLKSEKLFQKQGDIVNYSVVLLKKGVVQMETSNFYGAQKSLTKAYSFLKESEDYDRIYATLVSLGNISTELKDYQKAIQYYNEAINIISEDKIDNSNFKLEDCLNNIGLLYVDKGQYKKSYSFFEKALLNKDLIIKRPDLYSLIIDNFGYAKLKSNNFDLLPDLFFKSLNINNKSNNNLANIFVYNHLAEYYFVKGNINQSVSYSNLAINNSRKSSAPIYLINSLKKAAIFDKQNSNKYITEFIDLSDSLVVEERKNIDRFARIEFETDELRQEKSVLEERNRNILSYLLGTIVIGGFLFFIRIQRSRQRELALKQSQQQANEEIYRLIISHQNQLEEGRDLEKKRISKELHDGVLGRLFGLRLNLEGLNNFDDTDAKQTRQEYLNELKVIEQDLREISHELNRENLVLINNFEAIINNHLDQQAKNYKPKLTAHLSDNINWEILPNTTKINLYRILQEALQNINKHAEAKHISVQFVKDAKGNLLFTIEDDGKGYNTNSKRSMGIGLSNIVERVHQCEGKIDIRSQLGKGTKIMITFPLENDTINM